MHHRLVATVGTVAVLGATGGGLAIAKDAQHHDKAAPAAAFQQHLADDLHVSPADLKAAAKSAADQTVDDLQASGKLDAAKAAKLKKAIAKRGAAGFSRFGAGAQQGKNRPRRVALMTIAKALKVKPKDLIGELRSGKSPASVISEHGGDATAIHDAVQTAVRAALDPRVKAGGKLTADKADKAAAKIADRLTGDQPLKTGKKQKQKQG